MIDMWPNEFWLETWLTPERRYHGDPVAFERGEWGD